MLCPGCFSEEIKDQCNSCGYDLSIKRSPILLPHHTKLNQGRYLVGRLIGRLGGFGVTYLALDTRLQTIVAIKEYLPRDIAGREANQLTVHSHTSEDEDSFQYGLARFLEEARTLAKLDHPNIVRVRDFFEENGTAYLVMDYCHGLTLSEYIKRQPSGKIDPEQAVSIMMPILDGLREVHQKGFLHRDIKPQNIYLTSGNRPILLDFGAARQSMGERSKSLSVVLSEGYAPFEQYQRNGKQGPWTDIYGVAATLYTMVTGEAPISAMDRISDDSELPGLHSIQESFRQAIEHGLHSSITSRTQDVNGFQNELLGAIGRGYNINDEYSVYIESRNIPTSPPIISEISKAKENIRIGFIVIFLFVVWASYILLSDKEKRSQNVGSVSSRESTIEHYSQSPAPVIKPPPITAINPLIVDKGVPVPQVGKSEVEKLSAQDQELLNQAKVAKKNMHGSSTLSFYYPWSPSAYRQAASAFKEAARIDPANRNKWKNEEALALRRASEAEARHAD